jgi:hypothetical protein
MSMKRLLRATSAAGMCLAVLPLMFANLTSHSVPSHSRTGTVQGLLEKGSSDPVHSQPWPGVVTARRQGTTVATTMANKHGRYVLHLAPGRYTLTGRTRHSSLTCIYRHRVDVHAGETIKHVNLICPQP